ncbi:hypothetical protein F4860DRAFT_463187 [Xylaria cubensis]|nr:hypothetical protein F4860DRAFT_463187 [Xylaria cubensis]
MESSSLQEQHYLHENLVGETHSSLFVSPISTDLNSQSKNGHAGLGFIMKPQGTEAAVYLDQQDRTRPIVVSESSERSRSPSSSYSFTQQEKLNMDRPVSWWWWWEIGAAVLSTTSLIVLFILLFNSNGQPLQSWPLPIQPNSLIAVLTTIAKTSMMVPVASCLSQLKWRHFMHRSRPLNHFQVIDDASRGPWGSFVFLIRGSKIRTFLPLSLAFVTVVGLGFEPSAQQILDFPERASILANVSAEVGIATNYSSKAFIPEVIANTLVITADLFRLQSSIIDGISGAVFEPNFNCPSDYCVWKDFTTLGICSAYQNLTSEVKISCYEPDWELLFNCTYWFPDGRGSMVGWNITFGNVDNKRNKYGVEYFRSWFLPIRIATESAILSVVKVTKFAHLEPPVTESYFARFYFCAQTFRNVTATPRQLSYESIDVEELQLIDIKYDETARGCDTNIFSSSAGTNFTIDIAASGYLLNYLENLLTQVVAEVNSYAPRLFSPVDLATYLYVADIQNLSTNLATTLSNQIRSANPGDNNNATMHRGTAYTKEIYIHVRWGWTILPTAAVFITSVLLTCAILINVNRPLLKSSALALLFHGLDNDLVGVHIDQPETAERVEHAAKGMRVRLAAGREDPLLKFRRQELDDQSVVLQSPGTPRTRSMYIYC